MATDIERLTVLVEANTKQFSRAMEKLQKDTNRALSQSSRSVSLLDRSLKGAMATARSLAGAFGLGILTGGIAGIATAAQQAVSSVADLADAANRAGVSAEKLQVLRFALEQNGASAEHADAALSRLTKTIGEAVTSATGPAADIFKELSVNIREADGTIRATGDVFDDLVNSLSRVDSQAQVAAIGAKLFGREAGSALAPTLQQGSAALQDFEADLRSTGSLMSDDLVAKADELDDRFKRLQNTMSSAFKIAAVEIADEVTNIIGEMKRLFDNIPTRADAAAAGRMTGKLLAAGPAGTRVTGAFDALGSVSEDQQLRTALLRKRLGPAPDVDLDSGSDARARAMEREKQAVIELIGELERERTLIGATDSQRRVSNEIRRAGAVATDAQRDRITQLVTAVEAEASAHERMVNAMDTVRGTAADTFGGLISDIKAGTDAAQTLVNALDKVGSKLMDIALNAAIEGILGKTGTAAGGGGFLSRLFGGGRAAGGPVAPGKLYSVGERGPELFAPGSPGRIVPNAGQAVVVQNFDYRSKGQPVETQQSRGPNGEIVIKNWIRDEVSKIAGTNMGRQLGLSMPLATRG